MRSTLKGSAYSIVRLIELKGHSYAVVTLLPVLHLLSQRLGKHVVNKYGVVCIAKPVFGEL